ncbi:MAG: hypothetical protein [Circular genetic element sp.]|nr:MAG: hypothetical protein [Circular genetic element sp.]
MYIAFFIKTEKSSLDVLEALITSYEEVITYVIAFEESPYDHYHFLLNTSDKTYNAIIAKLKKDYALVGRARTIANQKFGKEYGRVSKINNLSKMLSYTLKDKTFRTNMPKEKIEEAIKSSFHKVPSIIDHDYKNNVFLYVQGRMNEKGITHNNTSFIKIQLIEKLRSDKVNCSPQKITNLYNSFLSNSAISAHQLYQIWYA